MKRVLFVDDDADALNRYREGVPPYQELGHSLFAQGATAALEVMSNMPIDVVVSDLHMAGMDGAMLLGRIKEDYPEVVRIMLCPATDQESIFDALPVSHQVLGKPCDFKTLFNVIERIGRLQALLTDAMRKRVGNIERLLSLPAVYRELMGAMSRRDVSIQKLARIVEKDAAMAAKTLQLVNSACFGVSRTITRIDQAVSYLGMELLKNLALTVHIFAALERTALRSGFSFEAEQEHSVLTARVARRFLHDPRPAQDAFTAGLLHDIGNLVLAVCIPEKFRMAVQTQERSGRPPHEIESELLGFTHAEAGAYLLSLWGLPYPIVEAVAFHHNPSAALETAFDVPTAVALADALVNDEKWGMASNLNFHLAALGVQDQLPGWTAITHEEMQLSIPRRQVS